MMKTEWERRRAAALLTLGRLLSRLGECNCAVELLQKALELMPDSVEARVEMGIVFGQNEDYQEMVQVFREAIHMDQHAVRAAIRKYPEDADMLHQILHSQDIKAETRVENQKAVPPLEVKEAGALVDLAVHHLSVGNNEEAVVVLERSLELDKSTWLPMVILSIAYLLLENHAWTPMRDVKKSVLWDVEPELATQLFSSH